MHQCENLFYPQPYEQRFVEEAFIRKGLPQIVFHDNACHLVATIYKGAGEGSPWHGTIVPVDVFHMKCHSLTDCFCQYWTNPNLFPELRTADGHWVFNSSAGEVVNLWIGGFGPMCRNMHPAQYNFFMSEMFRLRNEWLLMKISQRPSTQYHGYADF